MGFGKVLSGVLILALAGAAMPVAAAGTGEGYSNGERYSRINRRRGVIIYRERLQGPTSLGESFPGHIFSSAYNYPGWYNNQTFFERVETQAQYPVQY